MGTIMIVGADHLGNIEEKLYNLGYHNIIHIKGRKDLDVKKKMPKDIKMVLVLTDYINHNLAKKIKEEAKEYSLPIIFSKRSWSNIYTSLTKVS